MSRDAHLGARRSVQSTPASDFGAHLRASRRDRGLTRADVARWTRIPLRTIALLEDGEFDSLPAEVFVRGFLRSYAHTIGLDPDATLRSYDACRTPGPAASAANERMSETPTDRGGAHARSETEPPAAPHRARLAISFLALAALAALLAHCAASG